MHFRYPDSIDSIAILYSIFKTVSLSWLQFQVSHNTTMKTLILGHACSAADLFHRNVHASIAMRPKCDEKIAPNHFTANL